MVERLLPVLVRCGLEVLSMDGAMENVGLPLGWKVGLINIALESRHRSRVLFICRSRAWLSSVLASTLLMVEQTAQEFTKAVYSLPLELFDGLVRCAVKALSLQERYSLVAACNFLVRLFPL